MIDPTDLSLNYLPKLPRRKDWRIGCVGSGFIMRDCHLPAYRSAGFNPVAIVSRNPTTAAEVAARHSIPTVQPVAELLANPEVEILDVAVPPAAQPDLIRQAAAMGKGRLRGILAQKPLALSVAEARELVRVCDGAGVVRAHRHAVRKGLRQVRQRDEGDDRGRLGV